MHPRRRAEATLLETRQGQLVGIVIAALTAAGVDGIRRRAGGGQRPAAPATGASA